MGVTRIKEQNVKTLGESLDDKVGLETIRGVPYSKTKMCREMNEDLNPHCLH
jgi:hypothetical protein